MLSAIQRRTCEILFMTRERDRLATAVFLFIFALILVNVAIGVIETDVDIRESTNRALGFGAAEDAQAREVALGHGSPGHSIGFFWWFELISVLIFSIEYLLRIWSCGANAAYPGLFRGRLKLGSEPLMIVDLVAIAPFYIGLLIPTADLRFIRALRLFRIFRIFRSGKLAASFAVLANVMRSKREALVISTIVVAIMVVMSASVMYLAEHDNKHLRDARGQVLLDERGRPLVDNNHFQSVPASMWWAVITITTIGYGDTVPITTAGKILGSFIGFLGICVFALPVGIIGAGFVEETGKRSRDQEEAEEEGAHVSVGESGHAANARSECPHCGKPLAGVTDPGPHGPSAL